MIRVLDPTTAVRRKDSDPLPTLYVSDLLQVSQSVDTGVNGRLAGILRELGWRIEAADKPRPRRSYDLGIELRSARPIIIQLVVEPETAAAPPDAWVALQRILDADPDLETDIELVHVLMATTMTGVGGYWNGIGGYWNGIGGYWNGIGGYWNGIGGYWNGISASQLPAEFLSLIHI